MMTSRAFERQRLGDLDQLPLGERQVGDRRVGPEVDAEPLEQRLDRRRAASCGRSARNGPPQSGSRPMNTLAATSRLSNRLSSWWTKAMPAAIASATVSDGALDAVDADRARARRDDAAQDLHQRRLAGAVLADQPEPRRGATDKLTSSSAVTPG